MPRFRHNDLDFHYRESGKGIPFFFQHGLGGDVEQTFGIFCPPEGFRLITFDCRAHGHSSVGPREQIHLHTFAEDLLALMNYLEVKRAIVGGISMGAAVALKFAVRYPSRVMGLVLSRPAWLEGPNPFNVRMFGLVASLIKQHGAAEGLKVFQSLPEVAELRAKYPDTATAMEGQFLRERAEETCVNLEQIPLDNPASREEWRQISVPTLVIANKVDPVHPFEYGRELASNIPGAEFHEITSKSVNLDRHRQDVQRSIEKFLTTRFKYSNILC